MRIRIIQPCRIHETLGGDTYQIVSIGNRKVMAHRMIASAFCGKLIPKQFYIHHKDGNPINNDPRNLQVVTHSQNIEESYKDVRAYHYKSRLNPLQREKVVELYESGEYLVSDLCRTFNVSKSVIGRVLAKAGCAAYRWKKVSRAKREAILARYVPYKVSMRQLAEEFGLAENTILAIVRHGAKPVIARNRQFRPDLDTLSVAIKQGRKIPRVKRELRLREAARTQYPIRMPDPAAPRCDACGTRVPNHPAEGLVRIAGTGDDNVA